MKIAINRWEKAQRRAQEDPGGVEAWQLSLGAHWNAVAREKEAAH
jgi:hypothetical protein